MKNPFEKNDIIEIGIVDYGINGDGVARVDGVTIFIKEAIKGERVRAKIILVKPTFCRGVIEKIIEKSSYRVEPRCPIYSKCGGCVMQHIDYQEQLKIKCAEIENSFIKTAEMKIKVDSITSSNNEYNYRNKMSLPIRSVKISNTKMKEQEKNSANQKSGITEEIRIGFFRRGTHDVISVKECHLQKGESGKIINAITSFMTQNSITGYNEQTTSGELRHITVRELGGMVTVCLVGTKENGKKYVGFGKKLEQIYGKNYSLFYNCNKENTNIIYGKKFEHISGEQKEVLVDGLKMTIHPAGFFQVNDFVRERLFEATKGVITAQKVTSAIEAYAGAGVLACKLSKNLEKVYGIELNKESIIAFNEMARINQIDNVIFKKGDCKTELVKLLAKDDIDKENTALILDPPRTGISKEECDAVKENGTNVVIYISCNHATLARDIKTLKESYYVEKIDAYDMFPQTGAVEVMCILIRK